ncbi:ankyrin repeat domain-containing protein [Candidatus Anaplasma sp. TIGMIC]|uniref:ankyrin repeat domain-containing protein n=1 Tax=Candidatus Anaplasma sp. TIGMIC TaxID=3020713 RepID=UPI00232F00F9|nr:ankyrin repeat domain-containing protein [Candidatus Anaplasma sp. TIGMIC]MDB1135060.1 ankyrin repeat domain-containing protein [Candidatus Anaplasma sp. TIGMIC]
MGMPLTMPSDDGGTVSQEVVRRMNCVTRSVDVLSEIVRACKEDEQFAKKRLCVLHNKTKNSFVYAVSADTLPIVHWSRNDTVVLHECYVIHIPFIVGSSVYVDDVCDVCEFIVRRGGDIDSIAQQKAVASPVVAENILKAVCEQDEKTPIFYAVEKKCAQMVKKLINLGARSDIGMRETYNRSDNVLAVVYAMHEALKGYEREDGSYEVIDLLLDSIGVNNLIEAMGKDNATMDVGLGFVAMIGLDLEVTAGVLIEAVSGEHLNIIEFFLKCTRVLRNELNSFKATQKYKNMYFGRISVRRAESENAARVDSLQLTTRFRKCSVFAYPSLEVSYSPCESRNTMYSADIGNADTQILALAAYFGHVEVVKWLLANETICINRTNAYGYTALHFAASMNYVDVVEQLLNAGASVVPKKMPFTSAAHVAALNGALEVISYLHNKQPESLLYLDADGQNILHYAAGCASDSVRVVKYIVENVKAIDPHVRSDANKGHDVIMSHACEELSRTQSEGVTKADRDRIDELVCERGHSSSGSTPLYIAVESKNLNIAKFLIEHAGCDPTVMGPGGSTALNLKTDSGTLLHMAVRARDLGFVRKLLSFSELDLNVRSHGRTPMDLAIINRDKAVINILLEDPRQSLTTEVSCRMVPYSKVLSAKGLLDYNGRKVMMRRARNASRSRRSAVACAGVITFVVAAFVVATVLNANSLIPALGLSFSSTLSWKVQAICILALTAPISAVYIIYCRSQVVKEGQSCREHLHFPMGHERQVRSRKKDNSDSSSRYSDSMGTSGSGGTYKDLESLDEYLADVSEPANHGSRYRRRRVALYGAIKSHFSPQEGDVHDVKRGILCSSQSCSSESSSPGSRISGFHNRNREISPVMVSTCHGSRMPFVR